MVVEERDKRMEIERAPNSIKKNNLLWFLSVVVRELRDKREDVP